jgi:hypothetical protein
MREKGDGGGDFEFPPGGGSYSAASGAGGAGSTARCSSAPAGAPGGASGPSAVRRTGLARRRTRGQIWPGARQRGS